jgi:predicted Zn-dependent protease
MKLLVGLLALPLVAQQGVNFFSLEKERAMGDALAADVRRQGQPLDNAGVDAYVKRVGSQLIAQLPEQPFTYNFEVIVSPDATEPISIPGGHVFVPASFLLSAQNEAEFASMLAHSIGHIALRHGTRSATRGQLVNASSIPLIFMGGWGGAHAPAAARTSLIPLGFLRFQREFELDADRFGVQLASRAGYDARGLRTYVQRTQPSDANPTTSPLPPREQRLAKLDELLNETPQAQPSPNDDFRRVQEAAREALKQPVRRPPTLRK